MAAGAVLAEELLPGRQVGQLGRLQHVGDQSVDLLGGEDLAPHRHGLVGASGLDHAHCRRS